MTTNPAMRISVKNISKAFYIGNKTGDSALAKIIAFISGKEEKRKLQVLSDISFEASPGEIVGIIGRNGSGKSTLLRIIAGIYQSDAGHIKTHGKMIYLSGFGKGLRPKLTMADNIYLIGSIMGLSRSDIKRRFQDIIDFSGLNEYVYTKVYQFSSGMITRLNFSIAIHCIQHHAPDILLIDEVLDAGGDIDFKSKAQTKLQELIRGGATVILISHNMAEIKRYCNRVLYLKKGHVEKLGDADEAIAAYKKDVLT
jgi:ABC-type polysaccharide/polyol phosphate transport system ATPase subunit